MNGCSRVVGGFFRQLIPDRTVAGVSRRLGGKKISLPVVLACISLLVIAACASLLFLRHQAEVDSQTHLAAMMSEAQQLRATAMESTDVNEARARLGEAIKILDSALVAGADAQIVSDQKSAIGRDLDSVNNVVRIAAGTPLVDLSSFVSPSSSISRIVLRDQSLYILDSFSNGVYQYKLDTGQLAQSLRPGRLSDELQVGNVLSIAQEGDTVVALDQARVAYSLDATGIQWTATKLGGNASVSPTALATYDGNIYLLESRANQILKYPAGAYSAQPQEWLRAGSEVDASRMVDMAIDGSIYLLNSEGFVLKMSQGELKASLQAKPYPPVVGAASIIASPEDQNLWVFDKTGGRVIQMDRDGGLLRQYLVADGSQLLAEAEAVTVDEDHGRLYIGNGPRLYVASLTPLPSHTSSTVSSAYSHLLQ
jgi:hypothetical protein